MTIAGAPVPHPSSTSPVDEFASIPYTLFRIKIAVDFSGRKSSFCHGPISGAVVFFFSTSDQCSVVMSLDSKTKGSRFMKQENQIQGIAAAQVFVGGACYGANATMFKSAFAQGFIWPQVVACQMWFAAALFALAVITRRTQGNR